MSLAGKRTTTRKPEEDEVKKSGTSLQPRDLLQDILFFNTPHGWKNADVHFSSLQVMINRAISSYPNLLDQNNSLVALEVLCALYALRHSTYTVYVLLWLLCSNPDLQLLCLNHCHDRDHTLRFITAVTVKITKELDGPQGWCLFASPSQRESLFTLPENKEVSSLGKRDYNRCREKLGVGLDSSAEKAQLSARKLQKWSSDSAMKIGCGMDSFVQNCRDVWLDTASQESRDLFYESSHL